MDLVDYSSPKLDSVRDLIDQAKSVMQNAYAPFSRFKVGAALRTDKGNVYKGCNVENASLGGTICAERGAVMSAIAAEGAGKVMEIAIASGSEEPAPPCGICRQFLSQFMHQDARVYLVSTKSSSIRVVDFWELIPYSFTEF